MSQPRFLIFGAGGLGAAYASRFYTTDPTSVAFLASGDRYQRLADHGVVVNGQPYRIPVIAPDHPPYPADLIIVALKHQHLASALPDLRPFVGPETIVLSVMNGLDSEPMIDAAIGPGHTLLAIAMGIDALRTGNAVVFSTLGVIYFGERDNTLSPRVQAVQGWFDHARIAYRTPPDMRKIMWWKFMVNVGINQTSAVLGAPFGEFQRSADLRAVMEAAMREVIVLAQAEGVPLGEADITAFHDVLHNMHADGKTSMLQDVEAGRKTEVEIFAGKVRQLGQTRGIPTPVNDVLFHAIRTLEARYLPSAG